ncbi:hypothetical protein KJ761_01280 [Patescibacteria group bacterium]|nr:hypothetical protein [Patescibacteria group bacterium]
MKKNTVIAVLLVLLAGIFGATSLAADFGKAALTSTERLSVSYAAAKGADEKIGILEKLIAANRVDSHAAFYNLLRTANKSDISYFKTAFKKSGTTELLLNLGHYLKTLRANFKTKIENANMNPMEILALQLKVNQSFNPLSKNLMALSSEIAVVARKNPEALVRAIKKASIEKKKDDIDLVGPSLGLLAMKEDGAAVFLKSIDSDDKSSRALDVLVEAFGPDAVMPAFKQLENPASTATQKKTAGLAIFMFSDIEPVYDKVVEAYRHGSYFKLEGSKKTGKTGFSLNDLMKSALSGWWNLLESKYQDNEKFVIYVARKHLKNPDAQEEIIKLLADINFSAAAPYFAELNFAKLSEKSLDVLIQKATFIPSVSPYSLLKIDKKDYRAEKFNLFCLLFKRLDAKTRAEKKMIYGLSGFSPEYKELFAKSNIGIFTDDEKETIAFYCSRDNPREKMPEDIQKAILTALRQGASPKVLRFIEYVEKKTQ